MTPDFWKKIPTNEILESRFLFIDNQPLRENIVIYFRYIIFLLAISEDGSAESLSYSLYKDIILYTASIIESLLEYTVKREVFLGRADKRILGKGQKSEVVGTIRHSCNDLEDSKLQVIKNTSYFKLESKDRIDFKDVTHAAKTGHILSGTLYEAAEDLRKKRNTIHIATLTKSSDDYFKKEDVEKAFANAHDIIIELEKLYS